MSKTDLALSPRQTVPKKYPGRLWCSPLQAKPAHNALLCTDSKGDQTSKTSTAETFPLPPFCYALPVVLFLAFCIDRTGRAFNRIHNNGKAKAKKTSKAGKRHTIKRDHEKASKKENKQARHKQESLQACLLF